MQMTSQRSRFSSPAPSGPQDLEKGWSHWLPVFEGGEGGVLVSMGGESSGAPSSARRALLPSWSSRPVLTRHLPEAPSRRGETVCSLLRKVPAPRLQNMLLAARSNFRASRSVFPTQWALGGSRWHHPGDVLKKRFLFWSRRSKRGGKKPRQGSGLCGSRRELSRAVPCPGFPG